MYYECVTDGGASLAYLDLGAREGPARVYLGGLGSAGTVGFAPVAGHPLLAGTGRHVLVDLIGSGWSDHDDAFDHTIDRHAATVVTLLDRLGLRDVVLVGHSLGGSVAISLAAQRPDRVGRLVVAEPNLDPGVGTFSVRIAAHDEDEFAATVHPRAVRDGLDAAARGDVVAAQFARTLRRWSPRGLHRTAVSLIAERPVSFRDQLAALDVPRHYVGGGRSGEDLEPLRAAGCTVHVVPDAGHVMMWDDLDGFVAALHDAGHS
ncbi:alpha/beta fold hydrolase [Pseudonocardia endophytica]|uniref:Pimeloyl-ACP methyl ester carboxylesterase n=1 Tax=Pseudonocardia endophytica TaxID=401976 RepID=A0A4R1HQT3_PSEEN|nr:alpha/beta hydrolase [Pseudonocardia endophytica]TCK22119.1 pimeloyl-ACP methyl ester carboxylesterase [Pseudonocardia endophytica]